VIELLVVIVTGLVTIAGATVVGRRLGIAAPLVLVAIGVAASRRSPTTRWTRRPTPSGPGSSSSCARAAAG
jgi:hypothetical protein